MERINDTNDARQRTNNRTNNIHDSSLKVIKLTRHLINQDITEAKTLYQHYNSARLIIFLKIYQPLIIFNGRLYVKSAKEERIKPFKYLQFYREYKTEAYNEDVTIHVVSREYIQEYLNIIRPYYMIGAQYITAHENQITEIVKEDLIHWNDFNPFKINI